MSIPEVDALKDDYSYEITFRILMGKVGFKVWAKRMKKYLQSEGLWYLIDENEDPLETPDPYVEYNEQVLEDFGRDKKNDSVALAFIHKAISPDAFLEISDASTAREAWNLLYVKYAKVNSASKHVEEAEKTTRSQRKQKANDAPINVEEALIAKKSQQKRKKNSSCGVSNDKPDAMKSTARNEELHGGKKKKVQWLNEISREQQTQPTSTDVVLNMEDDHEYKHTFDVILTCCEVKPNYTMSFPSEVNSFLPSKNLIANVISTSRGFYKLLYYGQTAHKGLGMGWKRFVDEHGLIEGDRLKFKIIGSNDTVLECEVDLVRCNA